MLDITQQVVIMILYDILTLLTFFTDRKPITYSIKTALVVLQ